MAHGYPDYGNDPLALALQVTDLGELAARLGSPYNILRSGKVIFIDTFDDGITRWKQILNTGASIIHSSSNPYNGLYTIQLNAANVADAECIIDKFIPLLRKGKFGIDTLVRFDGDEFTLAPIFKPDITIFTGSEAYQASVKIDPNNGDIYLYTYVDNIKTWVKIYNGINKLYLGGWANMYNYVHFSIGFFPCIALTEYEHFYHCHHNHHLFVE